MFRKKKYEPEIYPAHHKKKRKIMWFWIGGCSLLILLVVGMLYFLLHISWLHVREFKVEGDTQVPRDMIVSEVTREMLTDSWRGWIGPGNILFWAFGKTPVNLDRFPEVKEVKVMSNLFARSVDITANERMPFAVLCESSSTQCFIMDNEGILFSPAPQTQGTLILRINDTTNRTFLLGMPFLPDTAWVQNMFSVLGALKRNDFIPLDISLDDLSLRTWSVKVIQGPTFVFSLNFAPDNFDSILSNLSEKLDFSKVSTVNFEVQNRIYYQ